jgi:hypothetical protein
MATGEERGGETQPAEPPEKSRHATPPPEAKPPTTNRATADRASNKTEPRSQPGPAASPLRSFPKRDVVSVTPKVGRVSITGWDLGTDTRPTPAKLAVPRRGALLFGTTRVGNQIV